MNVMVTGGRGFIGNFLTGLLVGRGDKVTVVSRTPQKVRTARVNVLVEAWLPDISRFDALVHLAGEPIFGRRWSPEQKENIRTSRVSSTRRLVDALGELAPEKRPKVLVSGSAIGFYGDRGEEVLGEESGPGEGFLAGVCREWEAEALRARDYGVRTVCLRTGVVLGMDGGALKQMLPPFKLGLGGPIGSGKQWMSWIHIRDLCRMILFAIDHGELDGPLNGVAPGPLTNKAFSKTLGKVLGRPALFPVPPLALRVLYGEAASILTDSQRCSSKKAEETGFDFEFREAEPALRRLLHK
jgi:uncharacterized protein (TIGR01777 family)